MKKLVSIAVLAIMLVLISVSGVFAATNSNLADILYSKGVKYGFTSADKVKIERYLSENPVTDSEADAIVAQADEAVALMEAEGVTDYRELSAEKKAELKTIANEAASIAGVTLSFDGSSVEVYKDGKLIDTITSSSNGKLAYTGSNYTAVVVSSIAVIALAATVVARKKLANA